MSNKITRCGVYAITTPNGSMYVGSSNKIERRWHEHRSELRHGKHHSSRLQAAWNKYGSHLEFSVLIECAQDELTLREQESIRKLRPVLNVNTDVFNVWSSKETRAKFRAIHTSDEWRAARAKVASESSTRWVPVVCDDGRQFKNMADAAREFGVGIPHITRLTETQRAGKLGVRIRRASDQWRDVLTMQEQRMATMRANGKDKRTPEAKERMSAAKKGRAVSPQCLAAAMAANRKSA